MIAIIHVHSLLSTPTADDPRQIPDHEGESEQSQEYQKRHLVGMSRASISKPRHDGDQTKKADGVAKTKLHTQANPYDSQPDAAEPDGDGSQQMKTLQKKAECQHQQVNASSEKEQSLTLHGMEVERGLMSFTLRLAGPAASGNSAFLPTRTECGAQPSLR